MSTDRAAHLDHGFGEAPNGRVEIVDGIRRADDDRGGSDKAKDLPEIDGPAFRAMNRRRVELIDRDLAGDLTGAEREELDRLEALCGAAVDRSFPLPPADLETLSRLRDQARSDKEGRGA